MQDPMQQSAPASNLIAVMAQRTNSDAHTMRASSFFPFLVLFLVAVVHPALAAPQTAPESPAPQPLQSSPASWTDAEKLAMLDRVIANQKKNDEGESIFGRVERKDDPQRLCSRKSKQPGMCLPGLESITLQLDQTANPQTKPCIEPISKN